MKRFLTTLVVFGLMMTSATYAVTDEKIDEINKSVNQGEKTELENYKDYIKPSSGDKKVIEDIEAKQGNVDVKDSKDTKNNVANTNKDSFANVANSNVTVSLKSQSKQELQRLYDRGFRMFEITVSATSDFQVVLAGNFDFYFSEFYGKSITRPTIDAYFAEKMLSGETQMSIGDINLFLDSHPDARFFIASQDQEINTFDLLNNLSIKNKDKMYIETGDVLNPYKSFENVAITDLKGEGNIYSYIVNSTDKQPIFLYKSHTPTEKERKELRKPGVRLIFAKNVSGISTADDESVGVLYDNVDSEVISLETPKPQVSKTYVRPKVQNDRFIAHAGGSIAGIIGSNSMQALEENYKKGTRIFELDFEWTSDGQLVCLHDWGTYTKLAQLERQKDPRMNFENFKKQNLIYNLKQMSVDDVVGFLKEHKDAYIVTDVKDANVSAQKIIAEKAGELKNRFIPQIYDTVEYSQVKNLGFDNIIFTLYRTSMSDYNVLEFAKRNRLYAVTMDNMYRANTGLPNLLMSMGQRVYLHTENNDMKVAGYFNAGKAYGVYSDNIITDGILNEKLAANSVYQALQAKNAQTLQQTNAAAQAQPVVQQTGNVAQGQSVETAIFN